MAAAEAVALLQTLRGQVLPVTEHMRRLLRRVRGGRLSTGKGAGLLALRAQALLLYLQDLGLLLGTKARGGSLGGLRGLPRLLEGRLVLEKLRPMELRLKYQLEKLLRAAAGGGRGPGDPLRFRPDPANMEEEEEEEEGPGGAKAPGLGGGRRYVPPRLVPVQLDAVGQERERRGREAARRRALSGSVIRELREELSDAPREEGGGGAGAAGPTARAARLRARHEEALLRRLRGRGGARGAGPEGAEPLAAITRFGDIGALLANQEQPPPARKKRPKGRKGRGRGFRRRR